MIKKYEEFLESIINMINFTKTERTLVDRHDEERMISFYQGMAYGAYKMFVEAHPELTTKLDEITEEWDEKILEAVRAWEIKPLFFLFFFKKLLTNITKYAIIRM